MKRFFALILCLCMVLAGCGGAVAPASSSDSGSVDEITINFSYGDRTGQYIGEKDDNGLPDGFGIFTAQKQDGTKWTYSGQWDHGHLNEYGTTAWDSGIVHFGKNSNDSVSGYGGYVYPDGRIILGEVDDNGLDGTGLLVSPNGFVIVGNAVSGVLQGWCTIYLTGKYDGYAFWGNFTDGNATGKVYAPDGSAAPATYNNGDLHFNETEFVAEEDATAEKEVPVQKGLLTEEQSNACDSLLESCKYNELHEYILGLIADGTLQEDGSSSELLGWLEQLEEISKKCEIVSDAFEKKTTVYYPGAKEISNQINVVPILQIGEYGASIEYELGFKRNDWLFFDEISITSQNKETETKSFNSYDINRGVIASGIKESVFSIFPNAAKFIDDENIIIRFSNTGKRENVDHQLTDLEIAAISTLVGFRDLHGKVDGRLWTYGKDG